MRCLVASDDEERGQHCREVLLRGGLDCPGTQLVTLDLAAERASRLAPDLSIVYLSGDLERGLTIIRELAVNVSTVLAKLHRECGLIDLRLAAGDLAHLLDLKPNYSVADVCQNLARMDRAMFERCFVQHGSGVHLLPAPRTADQLSSIN